MKHMKTQTQLLLTISVWKSRQTESFQYCSLYQKHKYKNKYARLLVLQIWIYLPHFLFHCTFQRISRFSCKIYFDFSSELWIACGIFRCAVFAHHPQSLHSCEIYFGFLPGTLLRPRAIELCKCGCYNQHHLFWGILLKTSSSAAVCDVRPAATKSWYCCHFPFTALGYFYSSYWLVCYWLLPIDGLQSVAWNWLMIIYNQLKMFCLFVFYSFFSYYFFRWMAYNHLSTFILYILCFSKSILCICLQLFMIYHLHLFAIVYDVLFVFICNCLWLVIYNPVLLIAIWPPSPSLSLWSPPRSGEWEYYVYVR